VTDEVIGARLHSWSTHSVKDRILILFASFPTPALGVHSACCSVDAVVVIGEVCRAWSWCFSFICCRDLNAYSFTPHSVCLCGQQGNFTFIWPHCSVILESCLNWFCFCRKFPLLTFSVCVWLGCGSNWTLLPAAGQYIIIWTKSTQMWRFMVCPSRFQGNFIVWC
jgi:hypothetical protein